MTQPEQSHAILQLIAERDNARTFADQLAAALARLAGVDIGDHTNGNNPWRNALDAADRLRGRVQAVDRAQMAVRFDLGPDLLAPRIFEDIARRWPDGTEPLTPPADLREEFPAELDQVHHAHTYGMACPVKGCRWPMDAADEVDDEQRCPNCAVGYDCTSGIYTPPAGAR